MPRWLSDDEQRTWRLYVAATRALAEQLDRELLRDAGVPHTYYETLARLSEAPGHTLRMSELAERSHSSRSRLSHAVGRLEQEGWVKRSPCDTDRRGAWATLTPEGMAALERAAPGHVEGVRTHLFDQLTPEQVAQLHDIAEAVAAHLGALPGSRRAAAPPADRSDAPAGPAGPHDGGGPGTGDGAVGGDSPAAAPLVPRA